VDIVSTLSNVVRGSDEVNVIARALAIFVEDKKSFEILRWCVNDNLDSSGTRLLLLAPTHFSFSNGSIFLVHYFRQRLSCPQLSASTFTATQLTTIDGLSF
jgi:hypothetical protein